MIVLGVDPGATVTGYGVVAAGGAPAALIECGAIRPRAGGPLAERLLEIFQGLTEVIDRVRPDVVCVEGVFYGRNARTTVILGHARGAVLLAAAARTIPVVEYPPAEVKSLIVGTGVASKEQVAFMVQKHLSLADVPEPEDAADGVAVALCHVFHDAVDRRTGGVGRKHG
ncbi:MAG: crossover junction endodeoxyribonuclease RuvC [Gemmatimonadetes bacterium]|uniref:Crossover junction endodeoxyribonuclease RuvC n=1 Tax=Candidatus Kutchimonas denitrificans TaxID=3056748 RepID=A0AAE5CC92_9BACT|nr:crossover junction endodeoxyribonuclease RuvC [Gemmatimonadota bacterium]NIR75513.1 crossover junction endodeoxyribonuclease RuvC [Candidatus Kutchimonas denitrificans]NIS01827.1 crossover junction endodeoxyribonuclease RuvC [Gemmatimonadota bacterium]NIT67608.1 crossover junction endodeoxyribonuclease RuvC [Gemmatimonadota bacterium]NIU53482.1 crossover junction endodeoxyribonuclease RuvC [Gemmatimonadota bacterium]